MKLIKLFAAILVAGALSACANVETATRGAPETSPVTAVNLGALSAEWNLVDVRVSAPETLRVSEANRYYPVADVVWRDDPFGNRLEQVSKVMDDAMTAGLKHLDGPRDVIFHATVHRFHSLTEKARYSVGGVHNIIYTLTVVDAQTGDPLHGPIRTEVDLKAYGGVQAFEAERRGHTQKVRITSHLMHKMQAQFPGKSFVVTKAEDDPLTLVAPAGLY